MQWNIEAQGNILKEGHGVGNYVERQMVCGSWWTENGLAGALVYRSCILKAPSYNFSVHGIFFTQIFLYKILMSNSVILNVPHAASLLTEFNQSNVNAK